MKSIKVFILLFFSIILLNCEKESSIVNEPPPKPLLSCGTLEYIHSMFVINNECWGENQPKEGLLYKENKFLQIYFSGKFLNYERILGIFEDPNYSNKKQFRIFYAITEGRDGVLSDYGNFFNTDSTQNIHITFNQDSTELEGKIKDLTLTGGANKHLPNIPDKIVISEGTFRVRLVR